MQTHLSLTNHCTHPHTFHWQIIAHAQIFHWQTTHTQFSWTNYCTHTHTHTHLSLTNHCTHTHILNWKQISYSRSGDDVDRSSRIGVGLCTAAIIHLQHRAEWLLPQSQWLALPAHTRMHASTHAHTHTHICMHTHTHTCPIPLLTDLSCSWAHALLIAELTWPGPHHTDRTSPPPPFLHPNCPLIFLS